MMDSQILLGQQWEMGKCPNQRKMVWVKQIMVLPRVSKVIPIYRYTHIPTFHKIRHKIFIISLHELELVLQVQFILLHDWEVTHS